MSSVCEWQRDEGPSLLAHGFPGLWVGAGMNSAGLALCWTSADLGKPNQQVRVGLPSYVFLAHLLYQENLDTVIREAKKDKHAGWFTFVMADGDGRLLNVEGSPRGIAVEEAKGKLVRIGFGTREMSGAPSGQPIPQHPRCQKTLDHLNGAKGPITREQMQNFFADPGCGISVGKPTIDMIGLRLLGQNRLAQSRPKLSHRLEAISVRISVMGPRHCSPIKMRRRSPVVLEPGLSSLPELLDKSAWPIFV